MPPADKDKPSAPLPPEVTDFYDVPGEVLGTGHFSKVKLGTDKKTGEKVAIKIIIKPSGSKINMLKTEVDILTKADHPNIVKLHKVIDTPEILYLVMELLTGGELFDRIIAKGHYSEADARELTVTMLKAVAYLHSQGIAHRDLKPENILLKDTSENAVIKITDFGLSKIFGGDAASEVVMKTACGTPGYVAPEVLQHEAYSSQVDLWSIGVIVYILLCGFPPFYGDNDNQMFRKIKAGQYKFLAPYWDPISKEAKDFVSKLLVVNHKERMDCEAALQHKWIAPTMAKEVSTSNLFANRKGEAKGGSETERESEVETMQTMFQEFNYDRKAPGMDQLRRHFELPSNCERIKKVKCYLGYSAGMMHITTTHLCFLGSSKKMFANEEVKELAKAKRFKLTPGKGHSIVIRKPSGDGASGSKADLESTQFNGFVSRDEVLALMAEQCKNAQVVEK